MLLSTLTMCDELENDDILIQISLNGWRKKCEWKKLSFIGKNTQWIKNKSKKKQIAAYYTKRGEKKKFAEVEKKKKESQKSNSCPTLQFDRRSLSKE